MGIASQLILLQVVIVAMIAFCVLSIRSRRFDDLIYDARISLPLRRFLMPGNLTGQDVWRKQQKFISWFGLITLAVRPQFHPTCTFENSIEKAA